MERMPQFDKITSFYRKQRRMPTYSEIMRLCSYKSKNAVFRLINKLVELELIKRDKSGKIVPGRRFFEIPVLGTVVAGFPSPAEEELADLMSLDEYLVENREATFMLKVDGDSMQGAGILQGDTVLVEQGADVKDGDIVIADIEGEFTMKYYRKQGKKIWFEPANKLFKPIYPTGDFRVVAKVKAVIRKY